MKRVSRGLLLGVAAALLSVCIPLAQATISVVGVEVTRAEDAIVFELQTTGPGNFRLDKLTERGAITAWSDQFQLDRGVTETPVDLDSELLGPIVSAAAMFSDPWRSGLRIYLGPEADVKHTTVVNEPRRTVITVPLLGAATLPGEPVKLDTGEQLSVDQLAVDTEAADTAEAIVAEGTELEQAEPLPLDAPAAASAVDTSVEEASAAGGSFFVPRAEQADVNYQFPPVSNLAAEGDGEGEAAPSGDAPMEDLGAMLEQMLTEMGAQADGAPATEPEPGGFETPGGAMAEGQFLAPAEITMVPDAKEPLADVTIDLFEIINTPLDQAITLLVAPTDYNVIVDASVRNNTVSLSFKDRRTDLKSALDLITKVYGLEYVVQSNTIVVAAKDKMAGNLMAYESRLFVLSYADPQSVKDMLLNTALLAEDQIEIYAGETAYPEVNDSTELSQASDDETQQIKQIESNLSSTPRNAVLVKALPDQMVMIADVIARLDRKPKIIELEVRVCEAGRSALRNLGVDLNSNSSTPIATGTTWSEQPNENDIIEAFTAGSFHRSPLQFLMTLNTQIQDGTVEILAQPTLSTVEGKQAIYFAGEEIPYISRVSQAGTGQTQIEVDFLNVGITLNFKPRLDADGKLTIDVNPIVSSLLEFRIIADLVEAPRTSTRQAATTVRVADGEPFVLAGLITDTERESITSIPILGDLPMIGKLFRNKDKKGERTEIIIVVTPRITN